MQACQALLKTKSHVGWKQEGEKGELFPLCLIGEKKHGSCIFPFFKKNISQKGGSYPRGFF